MYVCFQGTVNAAITKSVESQAQSRDRHLGYDIGKLEKGARKTSADVSSLRAQVESDAINTMAEISNLQTRLGSLETSQTQLCNKV